MGEKKTELVVVDTTSSACFKRIDTAWENRKPKQPKIERRAQRNMKVAAFSLILDILANIVTEEQRRAASKIYMATPSWFGCNASQAEQARDAKSDDGSDSVEEM